MSATVPPELDSQFQRIAAEQRRRAGEAFAGDDANQDSDVAPAVEGGLALEWRHLTRQSLAAHHFVDRVGHRVRFDHSREVWFIWRGHRWQLDRDDRIRRMWLGVLGDRFREALSSADDVVREKTIDAIKAAGALNNAIDAGLRIAASLKPVSMTGDEWDADPWALGCANGVVDLRTGQLRPGRPEDLITRSTGLSFDPAACCPRWEQFILEVFDGDTELATWFQRLVGATFIGVSNEIVAIHYGIGNNGKSVCFRILGLVAGDYGVEIGIETLVRGQRQAGAPSSDLMRLRGARLAFTAEPERDARLRGGTLKRLSTIDKMTGRELHGRQQEWEPTHTLHLATNHLPEVDDGSEGFWRRIALVPWTIHFTVPGEPADGPPADPGLSDALASEAMGILAWVVLGSVDYTNHGLHPFPAAVARETETYRSEEDPLAGFIESCLRPAVADGAVKVADLHSAYLKWAEEVQLPRAERLNDRRFGRWLAARQWRRPWRVKRTLVSGRAAYRGIEIAGDDGASVEANVAGGGFGELSAEESGSPHTSSDSAKTTNAAIKPTKPTTGIAEPEGGIEVPVIWDGNSPSQSDTNAGGEDSRS